MHRKTCCLTLALVALAPTPVLSAGEPTAEMLAYGCAGCHGTDGSSVGPATPSIAGTDATVFAEAMAAFKRGERASTIMGRIAKGYSDDEIEAMSRFFAAQKLERYPQRTDAARVADGRKLHETYCEQCHHDGGRDPKGAGILAGQWLPYLQIAMDQFLDGQRPYEEKMKTKVDALVKEHGKGALGDVIQYYGSQR